MKINKKETYSIDDLSKEELLFILEVIEKLQLSSDSTPEAHMAAKKFKEFREQIVGESKPTLVYEPLVCDGCETTIDVKDQLCPAEQVNKPLCPTCYVQRKHIADKING